MATIRLVGIEKRYPKARDAAIRHTDLAIADGEFFVLLGPSGCGKSTLLKLIAGLEEPTAGRIYIGDALVNYSPPGRRNVAMVFQDYALYPHMTVRENINFPLKMRRVSKSAAREAVARAAKALELDDFLERRIGALSGGQRQRVALARAIVRNPAAMLLDEPLSNLDAVLRVQTRDELLRLHRALQATTVYVTHDQTEAMTMGHRIAVMNQGVVEQLGTPRAVYDYPANTFVATFIGTPQMNLLSGRLTPRPGRHVFESGSINVDLGARFEHVINDSLLSSSSLGVRPGAVKLESTPARPGNTWQVELIEELGNERLAHVRLGSERVRALVPNRAAVAEGDTVAVSIDGADAHLFDGNGANVLNAPDGQPAASGDGSSKIADGGHEQHRVASEAG